MFGGGGGGGGAETFWLLVFPILRCAYGHVTLAQTHIMHARKGSGDIGTDRGFGKLCNRVIA